MWPCALVLSEFICTNLHLFHSKSVLELGCGTGICSIVASKIGSNIFLTDKFDCQQSVGLCRENIQLNNVEADLFPHEWGNINASLPKIDCLIGSDCFYDESDFEDLLCTISLLLNNATDPKNAKFYMAHQIRSSAHSIECLAKKWQLRCRIVSFQSQMSNNRQMIEIYEIKSSTNACP